MLLVVGEIQGGIYEQDVLCIFDDHLSNSHIVMLVYHIIHQCTPYWETLHHDLREDMAHNSFAFSFY